MQHAVGSPLPPPHQPGHGPAAGWSPAAHHPGPHHPGAHPRPAPVPPPPPGSRPAAAPRPPPHRSPARPRAPPAPQHAPGHARRRTPPAMCRCRPAAPSPMPSAPPAPARPDPAATTLAVLLIGPAGAGKTSVAKYWADHRRVPTAHISLDDVREWVRSGFADPQSGWNDHSEAQYRLARRTCGFAARNFLANGISCILDDAVFPDRPVVGLGGWKRHVGPRPAAGRPAARPGDRPGAQRRALRQPPPHRRGGRPHPRPHGGLVRLRASRSSTTPSWTYRPRPGSWTTYWRGR